MTKILIIDDNEELLQIVEIFLESCSYEVFTANTGTKGLYLAKTLKPDLIVCDIKIPDMTGFDILQAIKQDTEMSLPPFIFLTGENDSQSLREGMKLGADDYLLKPFEPHQLNDSINARLEKHLKQKEKYDKKLSNLRTNIVRSLPHELNTSLGGIIGFSEYLLEFYDEDMEKEEVIEVVGSIHRSAKRLERLTENFLFYSQLQMIKYDTEKLVSLTNEITPSIKKVIEDISAKKSQDYNRQQDLSLDIQDCSLQIASNYFEKAIFELIDNSFKFSEPDTKIEIRSEIDCNFCNITFTDYGKGFPKIDIDDIDSFVQFNRDKYEQQGVGFGFIISKLITEIFGGKLKISNITGVKTEIILCLPVTN